MSKKIAIIMCVSFFIGAMFDHWLYWLQNKEEVERAFEHGVSVGKRSMRPHLTDSFTLDTHSMATWEYDSTVPMMKVLDSDLKHLASKITVDSIEFKYDSIMVIHYNKSEIK